MKHTECEDCKLREGDCGHHFSLDGITNYDIPSLTACDRYCNCMFFQRKANVKRNSERHHGKWIGNNFDEHHCSICGHFALYEEEPDDYYEVQSNFCPNCGADMRKDDK